MTATADTHPRSLSPFDQRRGAEASGVGRSARPRKGVVSRCTVRRWRCWRSCMSPSAASLSSGAPSVSASASTWAACSIASARSNTRWWRSTAAAASAYAVILIGRPFTVTRPVGVLLHRWTLQKQQLVDRQNQLFLQAAEIGEFYFVPSARDVLLRPVRGTQVGVAWCASFWVHALSACA